MIDILIVLIVLFWILSLIVKPPKVSLINQYKQYKQNLIDREIEQKISNKISALEIKIQQFSFQSIFKPSTYKRKWHLEEIPDMAITEEEIKLLLSTKFLKGPYGLKLLTPRNIQSLPVFPSDLLNLKNESLNQRIKKLKKDIDDMHFKLIADIKQTNKLKTTYNLNQSSAIEKNTKLTIIKHALPKILQRKIDVFYESESRMILIVLEIQDLSSISIVKQKETKYSDDWIEESSKIKKKLKEDMLYSLCIRAGYLAAKSDTNNHIDLVIINVRQSWFDQATGAKKEGIIASLQTSKDNFASLQIDKIDPKTCFRYFKGIATPSVENVIAIKPIFDLDMNDRRIVAGKNVSESLDPNANLAAMPWDDFEHLVRQLFEWEFGNKGIEVKVTCASRDRGVDAIMFDSDPLKGGKYVLQAKRYNRTVDVAAVRDLYGTVVNEGANRGILVTTSSYGPDTYEFAKNKPISLVDGQHLVQMLKKHGKNYHIKLEKTVL